MNCCRRRVLPTATISQSHRPFERSRSRTAGKRCVVAGAVVCHGSPPIRLVSGADARRTGGGDGMLRRGGTIRTRT